MKMNWEKKLIGPFDIGYDSSFGTEIGRNKVSIWVSVKGYYLGFHWNE